MMTNNHHRLYWRLPLLLLSSLCLSACLGGHEEDLKQWMKDQRAAIKPNVPPIAEPKKFVPAKYVNDLSMEPFSNQKLLQALRRESSGNASAALVAPEVARRKEPLEAFPLDAMAMVGTVQPKGQLFALLRVDKNIYQVKTGQYLGPNYGKITKISDNEITLREIVQDAAGEWIERPATLTLLEGSK